jgi:NhaP-type Na+/H+ or K+/H+ antiporter
LQIVTRDFHVRLTTWCRAMQVAFVGCLGFVLGAVAGAAVGVGLGFVWISAFHTSEFEGYSGMLVFFTFMPLGAIMGALIGAVGLGAVAARDSGTQPPESN